MGNYSKDFVSWTIVKMRLEEGVDPPYFYEREIWWASIGHNIGYEEDGKGTEFGRPIVVLCKFNQHLFWGIPLTTVERHGKYYKYFPYSSERNSTALLSQLKAYDSKRLVNKWGVMNELDFEDMKKRIIKILN